MNNPHIVAMALLAGCPGFGSIEPPGLFQPPLPECPDYETHVSRIMTMYCITCHNESSPDREPLEIYEQTKALDEDIVGWINDASNPMPPSPQPLLTVHEVEVFETWISAGHAQTPEDCGDAQ